MPPANKDLAASPLNTRVTKLLRDAEAAEATGDVNVALIHLKQAVLLSPEDGKLHARLGKDLLRTGDAVGAERELRAARGYRAPEDMIVPSLLQAMITRGEFQQLLDEFPDPQQQTNSLAPDILRGRAVALQAVGRPTEADKAMDRSLALRRDAHGLDTRAQLAAQQNDPSLGLRLATEAFQLSANDEDSLGLYVLLLRQQNQAQKALDTLNSFISRHPKTIYGRALRADLFLALNQAAKTKEDADWIVENNPDNAYGPYYEALVTAQTKNAKAGWRDAASLSPEFIQSSPSIALTIARLAIAAGANESATVVLGTLISKHPEVAQARIELALLRLEENNPELALKALEPLRNDGNPRVQAILGQAYLQLQRYGDAIAALQKATTTEGAVEAQDILKRQLAHAEVQDGNAGGAVQALQEIRGRDARSLDLALQLADTLAAAGKVPQALATLEEIAKAQPKNPLPSFYRGQILARDHKLAAAGAAFADAIAIDPKFLPAYYSRASTELARGDAGDADRDLNYVTTQDPKNVPAYLLRAQIALNAGRESDAVSILQTAIKAAPIDAAPRLVLARYEFSRQKFADAQKTLVGVLQFAPDNAEAIALQGNILFSTGAKTEALEKFRSLSKKYPTSPDAQIAFAQALNRVGDRIGAETAAEKATELAPQVPAYRSQLIAMQIAHGKTVDALLTARSYRDDHPGPAADLVVAGTLSLLRRDAEAEALLEKSFAAKPDPNLGVDLSQMELKLGKAKRGVEVLALAVQKNPDDFILRRQYATAMMATGDTAGAKREFEALLKQRPDDEFVLQNLGKLIQTDDPDRAISLVSLAAKIDPLSAPINDNLGWLKYQHHDPSAALALLRRAHTLNPANPEFTYHYAIALDATGQREAAKKMLVTALARTPRFEDAKNAQQLVARW